MDKFIKLYDEVFDNKGNVKACTREKTKALIDCAKSLSPSNDFGNSDTGYMDIDAIKCLRNSIDL